MGEETLSKQGNLAWHQALKPAPMLSVIFHIVLSWLCNEKRRIKWLTGVRDRPKGKCHLDSYWMPGCLTETGMHLAYFHKKITETERARRETT